MSNYNDLLQEVETKIIEIKRNLMTTAKDYVPKLYKALFEEHPELTPLHAREKIESDCKNLWSNRTILQALPNEAKDEKKQKAGKLRHKNNKPIYAATNAAPNLRESVYIIDKLQEVSKNTFLNSEDNNNSSQCINNEFKEIHTVNSQNILKEEMINFEFCLSFNTVRQYMAQQYKFSGDHGDVWFCGQINTKTGKVIEANLGKKVDNDEI